MIICEEIGIGSIVKATKGRDKEKFFVIVGFHDSQHVLIVNGTTRRVEKPKKKKLMHLRGGHKISVKIKEDILAGIQILDKDVRSILKDFELRD